MPAQTKISRRNLLSAAGVAGASMTLAAGPALSQSATASGEDTVVATEFDYVIIGGGTAGPVLAARLTEDPNTSVLTIEAGPENTFETGEYAAGVGGMWAPATNWGFNSAPQPELNDRQINQPRGKVIGGSAAINVGSWSRGTRGNYESWNLPGWDWDTVVATYKRIEASQRSNTALRGTSGRMRLESTPRGSDMTDVFQLAAEQAGVGLTSDRNAEDPIGFDVWETIFPGGRRWNTEHGYLNDARARSNLTIVTEAHVTKINFEGKRAVSVSFIKGGQPQDVTAAKEILLCAGAINSPQILMLSGVGPADHLGDHGIDVVHDLPAVGENLADHLRAQVGALAPEGVGETAYADASDPEQLAEWRATGYGPLSVAENTSAAFVRSAPSAPHPDIELLYAINPPYSMRKDPSRAGWYLMVGLVQPKSKGSIRLASADPMDKAIYDPAYLSDPDDMKVMIAGLRLALAHVGTEALAPYTDMSTLSLSVDATDEEIEAHIRSTGESIYHPVGSVRMGADGDETAALDAQCRVKGVEGLRVVDASSIPELVSGHTMAPTILVAEYIATLIKSG